MTLTPTRPWRSAYPKGPFCTEVVSRSIQTTVQQPKALLRILPGVLEFPKSVHMYLAPRWEQVWNKRGQEVISNLF